MTDGQICRKISENLEPYSTLPKVSDVLALCIAEHPDYWEPSDEISGEWQPVDYFTDAAARDLLVREILGAGWEIHLYPQVGDERSMTVSLVPPDKKRPKYVSDTYDRIWPLAYLKTLPDGCRDCKEAAALAYSDATTPGFFEPTCTKHRPKTLPDAGEKE